MSSARLASDCHKIDPFTLREITLQPRKELLDQEIDARLELKNLVTTYLGLVAGGTLTRKLGQLKELESLSPTSHRAVSETAKITASFQIDGFATPLLKCIASAMRRAKSARRRLREYTIQNMEPIQLRLTLMEGPLMQVSLFDEQHVKQAIEIAQQRYHDLKSASLHPHQRSFNRYNSGNNNHKTKYNGKFNDKHKNPPSKKGFKKFQQGKKFTPNKQPFRGSSDRQQPFRGSQQYRSNKTSNSSSKNSSSTQDRQSSKF